MSCKHRGWKCGISKVVLLTWFVLSLYLPRYEDFSIASHIIPGEQNIHHLLMYHRHLESPSLAFYLDKIAQKQYLNAIDMPVSTSYAMKYQHELHGHGSALAAIQTQLPKHADYVVKTSHKKGKHIYVSYDEETGDQFMGSEPDKLGLAYDEGLVANAMAQDLEKTKLHILEAVVTSLVPAGIIIEDRFAASNSPQHPPTKISVIVIWGRVFMARMEHSEGKLRSGCRH
jgi:hypothetical protein